MIDYRNRKKWSNQVEFVGSLISLILLFILLVFGPPIYMGIMG